jgi:hypothetical protein
VTSVLWENIPLAVLFIAAVVGIPLWMTARRPDLAPDDSAARAYLAAKGAIAGAGAAPHPHATTATPTCSARASTAAPATAERRGPVKLLHPRAAAL